MSTNDLIEAPGLTDVHPRRRTFFPPLIHFGMKASLFACGMLAWVFKLKGDGAAGLLPVSPLQILIPLLGLTSLAVLLTMHGARWRRLMAPTFSSGSLKLGILLILFGACLHVSPGGDGVEAILYVVRWLLPALFLAFHALTMRDGISPRPMIYGFAAGAIITVISVELHRRGISVPVTAPYGGRYCGFLNHPNQYGILAATTSPILLWLFYSRRAVEKIAAIVLAVVYLLALFQCLSKTNIVLFFVSMLLGTLVLSLRNPKRLLQTVIFVVVLAFGTIFGADLGLAILKEVAPKDAKVIENAFYDPAGTESLDSREGLWDAAKLEISRNPISGIGPGRTLEAIGMDHAHNLFLQMYLDTGLPGFIGICLVVLGVAGRAGHFVLVALRSDEFLQDAGRWQLLCSLGTVIYICGNSMSDSFGTATMTTFVQLMAVAFGAFAINNQPNVPSHES